MAVEYESHVDFDHIDRRYDVGRVTSPLRRYRSKTSTSAKDLNQSLSSFPSYSEFGSTDGTAKDMSLISGSQSNVTGRYVPSRTCSFSKDDICSNVGVDEGREVVDEGREVVDEGHEVMSVNDREFAHVSSAYRMGPDASCDDEYKRFRSRSIQEFRPSGPPTTVHDLGLDYKDRIPKDNSQLPIFSMVYDQYQAPRSRYGDKYQLCGDISLTTQLVAATKKNENLSLTNSTDDISIGLSEGRPIDTRPNQFVEAGSSAPKYMDTPKSEETPGVFKPSVELQVGLASSPKCDCQTSSTPDTPKTTSGSIQIYSVDSQNEYSMDTSDVDLNVVDSVPGASEDTYYQMNTSVHQYLYNIIHKTGEVTNTYDKTIQYKRPIPHLTWNYDQDFSNDIDVIGVEQSGRSMY